MVRKRHAKNARIYFGNPHTWNIFDVLLDKSRMIIFPDFLIDEKRGQGGII